MCTNNKDGKPPSKIMCCVKWRDSAEELKCSCIGGDFRLFFVQKIIYNGVMIAQ